MLVSEAQWLFQALIPLLLPPAAGAPPVDPTSLTLIATVMNRVDELGMAKEIGPQLPPAELPALRAAAASLHLHATSAALAELKAAEAEACGEAEPRLEPSRCEQLVH